MPQIINSNIASLTAQRNLNMSQSSLNTSLERLSSGLRINSAKDDAAGLAISERMTSQIRGLNQASRNANDGISLAQTAEGAMGEIGNNLQRIRELSIQSANATNSASDRASLQAEVNQLTAEITRVAGSTQFNGLNLLDGTFTAQNFQVGANANQTIQIASINDSRATALGAASFTSSGTIANNTVIGANDGTAGANINGMDVVVDGDNFTITSGSLTTANIAYAVNSSAEDIATAITTAGTSAGISATAATKVTVDNLLADGAVTFKINGSAISAAAVATDLTTVVDAINAETTTTGVTATINAAKDGFDLTNTTGANIAMTDYVNGAAAGDIDFGGVSLIADTAATNSSVATGQVTVTGNGGDLSSTNANAELFNAAGETATLSAVSAVDITSALGAQASITVLDAALSQINSNRGDLGAVQNRFGSTIANLQTTSENLAAARSRIRDADFASETANMTRGQILQQAGVAILAQANSLPNNVLSLLR